jgi:hypothetical protein
MLRVAIGLHRAFAWLIPGFLTRLNRRLLTFHPFIWRTKVHYIAWYSVIIGDLLMFALGSFIPIERERVPTGLQLANMVAALRIFSCIALLYWVYVQWRLPIRESRPRVYLLTAAIYSACLFFVFSGPISFLLPVLQRIASVTPDREFAEEYLFHKTNHFWYSNPNLTREFVEQNRGAIERTLQRYGFQQTFRFRSANDPFDYDVWRFREDFPCVVFRTIKGQLVTRLFGDRLESVNNAKRFWKGEGSYTVYVKSLPYDVLRSLLLGAILVIVVSKKSLWSRSFIAAGATFSLPRISVKQPQWLTRFDRWLLTNRPIVWQARVHTFAYNTILYTVMVVLSTVMAIEAIWGRYAHHFASILWRSCQDSEMPFILGTLVLGVALAGMWAMAPLRTTLKAITRTQNALALALYCVGASLLPTVLAGTASTFIEQTPQLTLSLVLLLMGCCSLVSAVYLLKYVPLKLVILCFVISCADLVTLVLFEGSKVLAVTAILLWLALLVSIPYFKTRVQTASVLCALCFMSLPMMPLNIIALLGRDAEQAWVAVVFMIALYSLAVMLVSNVLVRCRFFPKRVFH